MFEHVHIQNAQRSEDFEGIEIIQNTICSVHPIEETMSKNDLVSNNARRKEFDCFVLPSHLFTHAYYVVMHFNQSENTRAEGYRCFV